METKADSLYRPLELSNRSIRILTLLPDSRSSKLSCVLRSVSLDNAPIFCALSYTWGDQSNPTSIVVNSQTFQVGTNLEQALLRLRKKTVSRDLWIDAVCINQQDLSERGSQVSLMRAIYEQASDVLVWLGEEGEKGRDGDVVEFFEDSVLSYVWNSAKSMFVTTKVQTRFDADGDTDFMLLALKFLQIVARDIHIVDITERFGNDMGFYEGIAVAVGKMMDSPWWERTWVVQESTLPQKLIFQYGRYQISHILIAQAVVRWRNHDTTCCNVPEELNALATMMGKLQPFLDLEVERRIWQKGTDMTVLQLCQGNRHRLATDDRDKMYGILSLVTKDPKMTPNYALTAEDIFIQVTFDHFVQQENFLPWFQGYTGDRVALTGECIPSGTRQDGHDPQIDRAIFQSWVELAGLEDPTKDYPLGGNLHDAFWRTFCGDTVSVRGQPQVAGRVWRRAHEHDEHGYISWIQMSDLSPLKGDVPETLLPYKEFLGLETYESDLGEASEIAHGIFSSTTGRRFFLTEAGLFGIGPEQTSVGDEIWLIKGAHAPFLLGNNEGELTMKGDVYVHGIMDGEAVKEGNWREVELV